MQISVVIISRNEAPRLRLTLESFAAQRLTGTGGLPSVDLEVVVVDDGSSDETAQVVAEASAHLPLHAISHIEARGRSASRNHGVSQARGDVVILFDGDCLASPDLVRRHAAVHSGGQEVVGRGETFHIRSTRFFLNPEDGTPFLGQEQRVQRMGRELFSALVTRAQVRAGFDQLLLRAEPGIYAGAVPRRIYELEMRALTEIPDASILWMAASAQNISFRRTAFLSAGGFREALTINEHRELALRLGQQGQKMVRVEGARSLHLLHRIGWRDPLEDHDWERAFYQLHPCLATKLMTVFWLSVAGDKEIPAEGRIDSLEALETIVKGGTAFDYDQLRRSHPRLLTLHSA